MGEMINAYKILAEKPEEKRSLRKSIRIWEDNIKVEVVGWEGMNWIHLAQDRDQWRAPVNSVLNLRVP
jgi:hypothetical protein